MIIDSLNNIEFYKNLLPDIYAGLSFIKSAKPDIPVGEYQISPRAKAIVSEYETVSDFKYGYEAHKKMIDIQYPIVGEERIKWTPIECAPVTTPYDEEKDRTFNARSKGPILDVDIGGGIFAVMFPADAHGPQHFVTRSMPIRKITIKVCAD
jgi:biofilm protein TabA